jgi:hypothetical protein
MTQPPSKQTRHLSAEDEPSETARLMLPGPEKNEALKKAGILRKTADATSPVATIDILYGHIVANPGSQYHLLHGQMEVTRFQRGGGAQKLSPKTLR